MRRPVLQDRRARPGRGCGRPRTAGARPAGSARRFSQHHCDANSPAPVKPGSDRADLARPDRPASAPGPARGARHCATRCLDSRRARRRRRGRSTSSSGTAPHRLSTGSACGAAAGAVTAVLGPNGAGKTTTIETCEGFAGRRRARSACSAWTRRRRPRAAPRVGVMLQDGGVYPPAPGPRGAAPRGRAARPPARRRRAARAAGAGRLRPHPVPAAVRRPAAAAHAGAGRRRPARAGVPRRADRRAGPAGPARGVGPGRRAARRRRRRWC